MAAVFAFGSFGDFVSLAQVANELRLAILDHRGAYTEYLQLVDELDKLITLLGSVDRTQQDFTRITGGAYDQDLQTYAETFHRSVNDTRVMIQQFKARLNSYGLRSQQPSSDMTLVVTSPLMTYQLPRGTFSNLRERITGISYRVRWTLSSARKEVKDFRIRLSNQYLVISMQRQEILTIMHALSAHKQQLSREFAALASQLVPRASIAHASEGYILLTDFLGETRTVPLQHCTTREAFHAFILAAFQDRLGLELIERGAYRLIPRSVMEGAHAWNAWEALLYPGAEVLLTAAMVISNRNEPLQKVLCPNCGSTITLRGQPREMVQCARFSCGTFFYGTYGLKIYRSVRSLPRAALTDQGNMSVIEGPRTLRILHYSVIPVAFKEQPSPDVYAMGLNIAKCFTQASAPLITLGTVGDLTAEMPPATLENVLLSMPPILDVVATSAKITEDMISDTLEASTARNLLDIAAAATLSELDSVRASPSAGISAECAGNRNGAVQLVLMDEGVARVWYLDSAINTPDREAIAFQLEASAGNTVGNDRITAIHNPPTVAHIQDLSDTDI